MTLATTLPLWIQPHLDSLETRCVGAVLEMDFHSVKVLTNDSLKENADGIPLNAFLVAIEWVRSPNQEQERLHHVLLLRVTSVMELTQNTARFATFEAVKQDVLSKFQSGLDERVRSDFQWGALDCAILGTFYEQDRGDHSVVCFGNDVENQSAHGRYRVYKPTDAWLTQILNHRNPEQLQKIQKEVHESGLDQMPEATAGTPSSFVLGHLRYTSTQSRYQDRHAIPFEVSANNFLARRTALFGMTRTGKSNTVKVLLSELGLLSVRHGGKIGQLVFDSNGEYANATIHDQQSSIADIFGAHCIRLSLNPPPNSSILDARVNFYEHPVLGLNLIQQHFAQKEGASSAQDFQTFLSSSILFSGHLPVNVVFHPDHFTRAPLLLLFWALLQKAGFPAPAYLRNYLGSLQVYLKKNFNGLQNDYIDHEDVAAYLALLVRRSSASNGGIIGYRALSDLKEYHTPVSQPKHCLDVIYTALKEGKIVVVDLSVGHPIIRTVMSERMAREVFERSQEELNKGVQLKNILVYIEEAHNLIGKHDSLTSVWARIAKEGAKSKLGMVYATQEPSSILENILSNTENFVVTQLNSEREVQAIGNFNGDFLHYRHSIRNAQDVGFARVKVLFSLFTLPLQIQEFLPEAVRSRLALLPTAFPSPNTIVTPSPPLSTATSTSAPLPRPAPSPPPSLGSYSRRRSAAHSSAE